MSKLARKIVWFLLTPKRWLYFWRKYRFVQDIAIDFYGLSEIRTVVADALNELEANLRREHNDDLEALTRKLQREHQLEISKLNGIIDMQKKRIASMKKKEDDADYKLFIAKTQIKENIRGAVAVISEANELTEVCAKIEVKSKRLKKLFEGQDSKLTQIAQGKRVSLDSSDM